MIDGRYAQVDAQHLRQQTGTAARVAGAVADLVGDVDATPTIVRNIDPQIAGNGEHRHLLGVFVDGRDHDHVGVLSPQVRGPVQPQQQDVHHVPLVAGGRQRRGAVDGCGSQGWCGRGSDSGRNGCCRRDRRCWCRRVGCSIGRIGGQRRGVARRDGRGQGRCRRRRRGCRSRICC